MHIYDLTFEQYGAENALHELSLKMTDGDATRAKALKSEFDHFIQRMIRLDDISLPVEHLQERLGFLVEATRPGVEAAVGPAALATVTQIYPAA